MRYSILFILLLGMLVVGCKASTQCEGANSRCDGPNLQVCTDGDWETVETCVSSGGECVERNGKAQCENAHSDSSQDSVEDLLSDTIEDSTTDSSDLLVDSENQDTENEEIIAEIDFQEDIQDEDPTEDLQEETLQQDSEDEEDIEEETEPICEDRDRDNHFGQGEGCDPEASDFDCDEERDDVYRGAEEFCDGVDNDCDGEIDEDFQCCADDQQPCYTGTPETRGIGECNDGIQTCEEDGSWGACQDEQLPVEEVCDRLDNDCDQDIDEGIECCESGDSEDCGINIGLCEFGQRFCDQNRVWGECLGGEGPESEVCDGEDNDCNGTTDRMEDELLSESCYSGPDGTAGIGTCQIGIQTCIEGQWSPCEGEVVPVEETCTNHGSDNDCDGIEDNIISLGDSCERTDTYGICIPGTIQCVEGNLACISAEEPHAETCLNPDSDDDCNGIEADIPGLEDICDTGELGICQLGVKECFDQDLRCMANFEPREETCSNLGADDDCNGIEDDIEDFGENCDTGVSGVCGPGIWSCVNGEIICLANEEPKDEECDGVDSDCDGITDELDEDSCSREEVCMEPGVCQCGELGGRCSSGELCLYGLCCAEGQCSSPMVTITEGVFMMGCNEDDPNCSCPENCSDDCPLECPYHPVNIPEFKIDVTEVTREQYGICVADNDSCSEPSTSSLSCNWRYSDRRTYPVNCLNWTQANAYCVWSGKRLCSESEWEKAARGTDGRIYPWGNEEATCDRSVMVGCPDSTQPVGSKPAGVYGLYDISGNVHEWVEDDWHDNYDNAPSDGSAWIDYPRTTNRIFRGGSFGNVATVLRASNRYYGDLERDIDYFGVRCCRSRCLESSDCQPNEICENGDCVPNPQACGVLGGICGENETCQQSLCCLNGRCSAPMVSIPAGPFMMGCNSEIDGNCDDDGRENPYHEVEVPDFEIDVTEVTMGQYRACVEDNDSCSDPSTYSGWCNWIYSDREEHPVNCISWTQAAEYCSWINKRLCSESEWEKAARGTDGRIYPWGNEQANCGHAVMNESGSPEEVFYGCGEEHTWPVGSKPSGMYGLYDMSGNVYEWVEDDYHSTYDNAPADGSTWVENPRASDRVIRGGGFYLDAAFMRSSLRHFAVPWDTSFVVGMRCCCDAP